MDVKPQPASAVLSGVNSVLKVNRDLRIHGRPYQSICVAVAQRAESARDATHRVSVVGSVVSQEPLFLRHRWRVCVCAKLEEEAGSYVETMNWLAICLTSCIDLASSNARGNGTFPLSSLK
jgi:hypothetical protein